MEPHPRTGKLTRPQYSPPQNGESSTCSRVARVVDEWVGGADMSMKRGKRKPLNTTRQAFDPRERLAACTRRR